MKRTNNRDLNLDHSSPKDSDLNQLSTGCAPCLDEALKIDRQINKRSLNEIKIDEIKNIVKSIFQSSDNDTQKN
tara:strand:+ start:266 stop:487 length:222 start_codon:yes stop_codon:yes gene_type:complete